MFSLSLSPPLGYMACPLHYDQVRRVVDEFLARCRIAPQIIEFPVQGVMHTLIVKDNKEQFQA